MSSESHAKRENRRSISQSFGPRDKCSKRFVKDASSGLSENWIEPLWSSRRAREDRSREPIDFSIILGLTGEIPPGEAAYRKNRQLELCKRGQLSPRTHDETLPVHR
jgi:hypothetical protein